MIRYILLFFIFISCSNKDDEILKNITTERIKDYFNRVDVEMDDDYFNKLLKIESFLLSESILESKTRNDYLIFLNNIKSEVTIRSIVLKQRNEYRIFSDYEGWTFRVIYREVLLEYLEGENLDVDLYELLNFYENITNFGIEFNKLYDLGKNIDYSSDYQRMSYLDLICRYCRAIDNNELLPQKIFY